MPARRVLALALLTSAVGSLLAGAAGAKPKRLALSPANTEIGFRVYGFGLLPVDGRFTRFRGVLTSDASDPAACTIEVSAEVESLDMPTAGMRATALAPGLLDSAAFPTMAFRGACRGEVLEGRLTLHGMAGDIGFSLARRGATMEAETRLRRADWGMTGRPDLIGETVRIRIALHNPATPGL